MCVRTVSPTLDAEAAVSAGADAFSLAFSACSSASSLRNADCTGSARVHTQVNAHKLYSAKGGTERGSACEDVRVCVRARTISLASFSSWLIVGLFLMRRALDAYLSVLTVSSCHRNGRRCR